ncbi:hypothetical protein SERLA73DRAFT_74531 [Serpula lacrymans var. lacrymans S7.3]|uniref:Cytochrome P450 n=1 Tax=Serpula lacrymans var. lacrymans (strain S7.3) TaxID=936435 RepID=F8PZI6_SERL3|nr:hypothetical protein SERLA73DRAFT_74531 [Serpula lacrymans var. lacrymans S7.3]
MSIDRLPLDIPIPLLLLAFLVAFGFANGLTKRKVLLPPGPRAVPILGNILGFDTNSPWITYMEWATVHGDLVYSRLLNQEIITINSEKVAKDLLERRSNIYSDRPQYITNDMCGWGFSSIFLNHGNTWRLHRRMFQQALRADAAMTYRPVQIRKVHQLLVNFLETPEEYSEHIQTLAASVVMEVTYGYDSAPRHDALVEAVERSTNILAKALSPEGAAILGALPFLRHIPAWFPGASFKRLTLECQQLTVGVVEIPFQYTKQSMAAGTAKLSMVSDLLSRTEQGDCHRELAIKHASASAFAAASETSSSTLNVFMLAMFLHPDVQRKAQLEIDSIIGRDRLPDFSDRPSLPYVEAVFRETLRWRPVAPLGIPHATKHDDHFEGYFIPKGAVVIPNIWAMAHNEDKYPDSNNFKPERFFTPDGKLNNDNVGFIFGFGRRVCVGRHIADATLWASFVSILATFSITKAKDRQGNEIEVTPKWTVGITTDEPREAVADD